MRKIQCYYLELNQILNQAEEHALEHEDEKNVIELLNQAGRVYDLINIEIDLINRIYKMPEEMLQMIKKNDRRYNAKRGQIIGILSA